MPGTMKAGMTFTIEPMICVGNQQEVHWPDNVSAPSHASQDAEGRDRPLTWLVTGCLYKHSGPRQPRTARSLRSLRRRWSLLRLGSRSSRSRLGGRYPSSGLTRRSLLQWITRLLTTCAFAGREDAAFSQGESAPA